MDGVGWTFFVDSWGCVEKYFGWVGWVDIFYGWVGVGEGWWMYIFGELGGGGNFIRMSGSGGGIFWVGSGRWG